jgi:hypothetical protein
MGKQSLPTQVQLFDQLAILSYIGRSQVVQQPTAATNKLQQTVARAKVLSMRFEMGCELIDAFGEKGDLDSRASSIGCVLLESLNG